MQPRTLGRSDVKVSPVIFGAWAIGGWMWGGSEESESIAAIHASLDAGVNTIDTAGIYGMGYSEELVAKARSCFRLWRAGLQERRASPTSPTSDMAGREDWSQAEPL